MKPKKSKYLLFPVCILVGSMAAPFVQAASDSWNVDAAGNWTTFGSWLSGIQAPGSTTLDNTDIATFSNTLTGARAVTVDADRYIGGLSFGNTSVFGYTLGTGILHLNSGGVIQTLATNGNHTDAISSAVVISGAAAAKATITAGATSASSLLSISGGITGSATASNTTLLTLNGTNTGSNTVSGIIGNGSGGGALGLTKEGSGNWKLTGANTYTGATTINRGVLNLDFAASGAPSSGIINNGAISNATANSALILGGGNLTLNGKSATTSAQYFANTTLSPNSGSIVTLNQNGATSLTASLGAITRNAGSTLSFSNVPLPGGIMATTSNSNTNGILGTWAAVGTTTALQYATVNGSNQIVGYAGATAATAGTLSNVTSAVDNYSLAAGATLNGNITANTLRSTGAATIVNNNGNSMTLNGLMNAGTGDLTLTGGSQVVIGSNQELVILGNDKNININSKIVNNGAGASSLIYSGPNNLTLGGANAYTGGTVVNSGTLTAGLKIEGALGMGSVTVNAGAKFSAQNNVLIANNFILNNGTIESSFGFPLTFGGALTLSGINTLDTTTTGNFGFTGNVSGTGGLTKLGASVVPVTLSGMNTYSGPTTVSAGALLVKSSLYGNDTAQWTPANIKVASGASLMLNVGGVSDFTVAQAGTMLSNLSTGLNNNGLLAGSIFGMDTSNAAGPVTFAGTITDSTGVGGGAVGITKYGNATSALRLTGANTYTGKTSIYGTMIATTLNSVVGGTASSNLGAPTTVLNGTINFGDSGGAGSTSALVYNGTGETTDRVMNLAAQSGTVTFDQQGTGLLKFSSAFTVNNNGGKTINLQGSTTGTGEILLGIPASTSNLNVTKNGTGTWTLSGTNLYANATTINGGLLKVNGSTAAGAVAVNAGGALGGTGTVGGAVTLAVGTTSTVIGTATLAGGAIRLTDGAVGTLNLSSTLNLNGTAANPNNLYFDLGAGVATTDKIVTVGAVTAANAGGVLVNMNQLAGGAVTPGTGKVLIQAGAASTYANYVLATSRSGGNVYSNLTTSGNNLVVDIATATAGPAAAFWVGGANPWSTAANWNTDATSSVALGSIPGVGTNVSFATTTPAATNLTTNTVDTDFEINSLNFNAAAGGVTIGGTKMLTLDATSANGNTAGNGITASNTSGIDSISAKIGLGNSQTWTTNGGTLTVDGAITDFGAGYTLTKAGAGTLTLNGLNTYTGGTVVTAGTLSTVGPNGTSAAFGSGSVTLNNGTTLMVTGLNSTTFNNAFILPSGTATIAAPLIGGGTPTLAGLISGAGGLIMTSDAAGRNLTLANANTFTGGVTLSGGAVSPRLTISNIAALGTGTLRSDLTAGSNGGLDWNADLSVGSGVTNNIDLTAAGANFNFGSNSNSNAKFSGVISGLGTMVKGGTTIAVLSGANTYSGGTAVNAGTLTFLNTAAKPTTGTTSVAAGATLGLGVGGSGFFSSADVDAQFLGTLTNVTRNATSIVGIDTAAGDFTYATSNTTSTLGMSKLGINTLTVSGNNAYSGLTTVVAGTLKLGAAGDGTNTPLGTSAGGTVINTGAVLDLNGITLSTAEALTVNGTGLSGGGALINTGLTAATYSGLLTLTASSSLVATNADIILSNTGTISGSNLDLTLGGNLTATVGSSIASNIATVNGAVIKNGSGTWTLSGNNSYAGGTTINNGTLKLGAAGVGGNTPLGTAASGTSVNSGGTLDLNGITLSTAEALSLNGTGLDATGALANSSATAVTYSGLVSLGGAATIASYGGNIALTNTGTITGAKNLTLDGTAAGSSVASIIGTSTGTLTKNGTGTWTLTGNSTYSGATAVNAGTLMINGANVGTGLVSVAAGAIIGGTGSGAGAMNVTGVLAAGGVSAIESFGSGALTMNSGSTFSYDSSNNTAAGADLMVINGALSLTAVNLGLNSANLGLNTWATNDKLTLISYTGTAITSGFTGYNDDTVYNFGGNQWLLNYNDTSKGLNFGADATGTSFVTFTMITAVPEPSSAMLVGGLGLLAMFRRRRNS